jgi:hypothetical protein
MSEPFLNKECTKMILYAFSKGHRIFLCTTMVGMKKEDLQVILNRVFKADKGCTIILHLPANEKIENIKVDKEYLECLTAILEANVTVEYHHHGNKVNRKIAKKLKLMEIAPIFIKPKLRAGNLMIKGVPVQKRKLGKLSCYRHNLDGFMVLPDGRVVLCCMDYSIKHFMGNLVTSSYQSIRDGKENRLINESLLDDRKEDILCRYCHDGAFVDEYSELKNMDFSWEKVKLGLRILVLEKVGRKRVM